MRHSISSQLFHLLFSTIDSAERSLCLVHIFFVPLNILFIRQSVFFFFFSLTLSSTVCGCGAWSDPIKLIAMIFISRPHFCCYFYLLSFGWRRRERARIHTVHSTSKGTVAVTMTTSCRQEVQEDDYAYRLRLGETACYGSGRVLKMYSGRICICILLLFRCVGFCLAIALCSTVGCPSALLQMNIVRWHWLSLNSGRNAGSISVISICLWAAHTHIQTDSHAGHILGATRVLARRCRARYWRLKRYIHRQRRVKMTVCLRWIFLRLYACVVLEWMGYFLKRVYSMRLVFLYTSFLVIVDVASSSSSFPFLFKICVTIVMALLSWFMDWRFRCFRRFLFALGRCHCAV